MERKKGNGLIAGRRKVQTHPSVEASSPKGQKTTNRGTSGAVRVPKRDDLDCKPSKLKLDASVDVTTGASIKLLNQLTTRGNRKPGETLEDRLQKLGTVEFEYPNANEIRKAAWRKGKG